MRHATIPPLSPLVPRLLLVAHPTVLATAITIAARAAGQQVDAVASVGDAVRVIPGFAPSVLLLDLDDTGRDAMAQIDRLAAVGAAGLMVMLARDDEPGRIACLDRGADDVVPRRVAPAELLARIRALHRRLERVAQMVAVGDTGMLALDPAHRCVVGLRGERTALSEAEFIALETLLDADGAPVSRDWLGRVALKRPLHADDRSVDQLVLKLRRKLSAVGAADRTILAARRQGYVIADPSRFSVPTGVSNDGQPRPLVAATED